MTDFNIKVSFEEKDGKYSLIITCANEPEQEELLKELGVPQNYIFTSYFDTSPDHWPKGQLFLKESEVVIKFTLPENITSNPEIWLRENVRSLIVKYFLENGEQVESLAIPLKPQTLQT